MPQSQFGGITVDSTGASVSQFGGLPVDQPAQQEQPSFWSRVGGAIANTLSKTAHNLDVTPMPDKIGEADDLAGQGRWGDAWNTIRDLLPGGSPSQQVLGNQQGTTLQEQIDFAKDTYNKAKSGDVSGTAANLLTAALLNGHHLAPAASAALDAISKAGSSAAETVSNALQSPTGAGAKAFAKAIVPEIAKTIPGVKGIVAAAEKASAAKRAAQEAYATAAAQNAPTTEPVAEPAAEAQTAAQPNQPTSSTSAAAPSAPPEPALDPEFLDQVARAQAKKPFAKLTPAEQASVRTLATRLSAQASQEVQRVSEPTTAAPPEDLAENPRSAASAEQTPAGSSPAAPAAASSLPESAPAPETSPSPAAEPAAVQGNSQAQVTAAAAPEPSASRTTPPLSAEVMAQRQQMYPEGGPTHIPTPAEVGFGVYTNIRPEDSSTLLHIRAENEKAFKAADFAFKNGITDPNDLAAMTEDQKRAFMNGSPDKPGALQHGRTVGNPTPKTKYRTNPQTGSILDGHTLRLAQAHLAKMVADAAADADQPGGSTSAEGSAAGPRSIPAGKPLLSGAQIEAGRMMRPFPDIPFDPANATREEVLRNSRILYRPGKGGHQGIVYLNPQARELLTYVGKAAETDDYGGYWMNAPKAKAVVKKLDRSMLTNQFGIGAIKPLFQIRQALKQSLKDNDGVMVVEAGPGSTLGEVRSTIYHEAHHASETDFSPKQARGFLEDPIAYKAGRTLVEDFGYDDEPVNLTSEIGAHLQQGPSGWADLDLTPEQADVLWRRYVRQYPGSFQFDRMRPTLRKAANEELGLRKSSGGPGEQR